MIYLDNAATTGNKPFSVIKAVNNALINYNANPGRSGHDLSIKVAEELLKCRCKIKEFFNCTSENNVCFTQNCTHAINIVLQGVLNQGDHVIISSLEHNAVFRPLNYLREQKQVEFDIAQVDLYDDEITLQNIKNLIKNNTKMIFLTAASNVVGKKLPIKKIGALCKEANLLFGVDAAQAAGKNKIDVIDMSIDYLCFAPHKGFYAPTGLGVLIAEKPIENILISGGTGVNSIEFLQPADLPERIESGTQNIPGIIGLKEGIDFINYKGINKVESYEISLIKYCYFELQKIGAELYTQPPTINNFAPVLSFNVKGYQSEQVGEYLNKNQIAVRAGLHCAPLAHKQLKTLERGTVRVSPSVFNNKNQLEKLIFYIKRLI